MHKARYIPILIVTGVFLLFFAQYTWQHTVYWLNHNTVMYTNHAQPNFSGSRPNEIRIPSLTISAPIVYASSSVESEVQELLRLGVVHYAGTAAPGEVGNCYLFGHSSDYLWSKGNYKTIFATLSHIQHGSVILVTNNKGAIFSYRVVETKVVNPDDLSPLSQATNKKMLTLQSSYPLGTALKRFIVIAELQE